MTEQPPQAPVPSYGYLPPPTTYVPFPVMDGAADPNDPLINPRGAGIGGWFARISQVFKRSWRGIAAIFAITTLLPTAAVAGFAVAFTAQMNQWSVSFQEQTAAATANGQTPQFTFPTFAPTLVAIFVLVGIASYVLQLVGYGAATYLVTREAAGESVPLGSALGYGFRRCAGLFGWLLLAGLLTMLGIVCCILPGIYVYAATALVGPIFLFERRSPIQRSFQLFHRNLGVVLGRLALTAVISLVGGVVLSGVEALARAIAGVSDPTLASPAVIAIAVVGSMLALPVTLFEFVAVLLTYTEQRGYEAPQTRTQQLAAELG